MEGNSPLSNSLLNIGQSGIASVLSSGLQAYYNRRAADVAYKRQLSMMREQMKFNSEEAEKQRYASSPEYLYSQYKKLGLNTDLMYGQGGFVGSMSSASAPAGGAVTPAAGIHSDLGGIISEQIRSERLADSVIKRNEAEANKDNSEADVHKGTVELQKIWGENAVYEGELTRQQKIESEERVNQMRTTYDNYYRALSDNLRSSSKYTDDKNLREQGIFELDYDFKKFVNEHQQELYNATLSHLKAQVRNLNSSSNLYNKQSSLTQRQVDYYCEQLAMQGFDLIIKAAQTGRFDMSDISFNINGDAGDGVLRFERSSGKGDISFDGTIKDETVLNDVMGIVDNVLGFALQAIIFKRISFGKRLPIGFNPGKIIKKPIGFGS